MRHGTYSIVALDPETGELGAAVQSHWFSVGSLCTWARPGVGAVATQSVVEPAHGPNALDRLERGDSAEEALGALLDADPLAAVRQVGVVDARGGVAVHTGPDCIEHAGDAERRALDLPGQHDGARDGARRRCPPPSRRRRATSRTGCSPRCGRPRARAATSAGASRRRCSSCPRRARHGAHASTCAWRTTSDPLAELERLLGLWRAYELAGAADELMAAERFEEAGALYRRAAELAPGSDELLFWAGLAIAHAGELDEGVAAVRRAAEVQPNWLVLLDRLSPDFAPAGAAVRAALGR